MSLRKIAAKLAARGHLTAYGKPYVAKCCVQHARLNAAPAAICGAMRANLF
jgi:hypothetical protein